MLPQQICFWLKYNFFAKKLQNKPYFICLTSKFGLNPRFFHINPTFPLILDFSGYFLLSSQNHIFTLDMKLFLDFYKVFAVKNPSHHFSKPSLLQASLFQTIISPSPHFSKPSPLQFKPTA